MRDTASGRLGSAAGLVACMLSANDNNRGHRLGRADHTVNERPSPPDAMPIGPRRDATMIAGHEGATGDRAPEKHPRFA